ncbi:MAG: hypothetical protein H0W72_02880 [Planctomycetes bacterium]|nr:hypothetical protein [Planctomycetota bacterium]
MIVMPSNNTGIRVGYLAGRYPGLLGHLYSVEATAGPFHFMPYALDNGAFPAFVKGEAWNEPAYWALINWCRLQTQAPRWVLVPDVVGEREATISSWHRWAPILREFGWPLAFAAQDGMTPADVPAEASVVFLGGSTEWKRQAIGPWCAAFPRVHVGRINTYRWLWYCADAGAESCDGTGWTRGDQDQWRGLEQWLSEASGESARSIQTWCDFGPSGPLTVAGGRSS